MSLANASTGEEPISAQMRAPSVTQRQTPPYRRVMAKKDATLIPEPR